LEAGVRVKTRPANGKFDGRRSELGCVASIFLPPVPEWRSRQPPLLSRRGVPELGLAGPIRRDTPVPPALQKPPILFSGQIVVPLATFLCEVSASFLSKRGPDGVRRPSPPPDLCSHHRIADAIDQATRDNA